MRSWGGFVCAVLALGVVATCSWGRAETVLTPETDRASVTPVELTQEAEELQRRIEENPSDVELRVTLGNLYYENHIYDEALATYLAATEVDSTHVGVRLNLGALYTDMRRYEEAIGQYERAIALDPSNAMVYANLGSTYYARSQYQKAVDAYLMALSIDEGNVEAHFNLGVAFADAQIFDEAIREWERVIELAPESDAAGICRGNIEMIRDFTSQK